MREVTSATNPLIKLFRRSLAQGVTREGWIALEGPLLVAEAIQATADDRKSPGLSCACTVRSVLIARSAASKFAPLLARLPAASEATVIPDSMFERISATVTPQGIAVLVEIVHPPLDRILAANDAVLMVAFGVRDPGNLGTILRSSEGLGAHAVVTLHSTVSPFNPKVVRACGGALFRLPVFAALRPAEFFEQLRSAGVRVLAACRRSPRNLADADLQGRLAFLIGNEAAGLPPGIRPDASVAIPVRPGVDSLNAAVAAGILLYETASQRGFKY
ncbi:MAG: TrmH family RNA methyltransferase [Terriglobia bacterium]